jgi:hypothetical protein
MNDILSSLETEYGFAALDHAGERLNAGRIAEQFTRELEARYAWLPAAEGGCFLGNGARLYWDAGAHPEYAAPECAGHPKELVAHVRAGHQIMLRTARRIERDERVSQVRIWRGNVDYTSGMSWGCHESYLTRRTCQALSTDLVPHLVSRVIYGGAGGFSLADHSRVSLSPRLELFTLRESPDTMGMRGIINTRDEPHAAKHRRLHLICRDNVTSQLADLLSIGMTRLVVALADMHLNPSEGLQLDDEVAALHTFCRDTTCRARVRTTHGAISAISAIEIQRHYLERIDAHSDRLPGWSSEIVELCGGVLDQLGDDPRSLCGKLDWPTKLAIFERETPCDQAERLMQDTLLSELDQTLLTDLYARTGADVVSAAEIEAAVTEAPASTRARIRGRVVKRLSGQRDSYCEWTGVQNGDRRLRLDDPFEGRERWQTTDNRL